MKKTAAVLLIFFTFSIFLFQSSVHADLVDDLQKQIDDLRRSLEMSVSATRPLEATLTNLENQIADIRAKIAVLEEEVQKKEEEVATGDKVLTLKNDMLETRIRSLYINNYNTTNTLYQLLFSHDFSANIRVLGYQKSLLDDDKKTIADIAVYIKDLEIKKEELSREKTQLASAKIEIDKQAEFFRKEIKGAKAYQKSLNQQIVQLTARQQEILAQRLASLNISRSAASIGRCDSDLTNGRDPGFSPKFAVFTYGVPNRVGLNQWGAFGRAQVGQGYEQILRAYYNFDEFKGYDTNIQIRVDGYGSYSLEDYIKRIYEVPADWPMEALKAQAIAARSYVLAYTNNGSGSICATEQCQVFKPDPKGGPWEQAVSETSGKAMAQGGQPIKAWFSSTHGGYIFGSGEIGWSGTGWTKHATDTVGSVNSFSDLQNNAYDKSSPWFYCDWGSRADYNKTAWLKSDEMADIVNTLMLVKRDSGTAENLYQTDKPSPAGKEIWNADRVKSELRSRGTSPYNNVSDISVSADFGYGRTTSVNVNGDAGNNSFDANDFKNRFNLRAPANIQIVGPLFNIEKR